MSDPTLGHKMDTTDPNYGHYSKIILFIING